MNGSTITFTGAKDGTISSVLLWVKRLCQFDTVGEPNEMGVTAWSRFGSHGVVVDSSKNVTGFNQVTSTTFSGIFSGCLSSSSDDTNISGSIHGVKLIV